MELFAVAHQGLGLIFPSTGSLDYVVCRLDGMNNDDKEYELRVDYGADLAVHDQALNQYIKVRILAGGSVENTDIGVFVPYIAIEAEEKSGNVFIVLLEIGWRTGRLRQISMWATTLKCTWMAITDGPIVFWSVCHFQILL